MECERSRRDREELVAFLRQARDLEQYSDRMLIKGVNLDVLRVVEDQDLNDLASKLGMLDGDLYLLRSMIKSLRKKEDTRRDEGHIDNNLNTTASPINSSRNNTANDINLATTTSKIGRESIQPGFTDTVGNRYKVGKLALNQDRF